MAPPAERPPSEQGIEYRTLDAVAELARKVDELAQRPAIVLPAHGNWWDVLPRTDYPAVNDWSEIFSPIGYVSPLQLPTRNPSTYVVLRAALMADRLELSLQLNGGWIVWQRALFFERPAAA